MTNNHKNYFSYRILEIIPGLAVWLTFAIVIFVAIWHPLIGVYIIIAFDIYWILRILYLLIFLLISWFQY